MIITILMSKHLVLAVLCIEEEIFYRLGRGFALRLVSFTLVPEKVTEQALGNRFQIDKGHEGSQPIFMQRKLS